MTPRTAAGRALLETYTENAWPIQAGDILAIEAEAAALERAKWREFAADRLTAIIESRMSRELAVLDDDGKTVTMMGPELVASVLVHLYLTGDIVSGLPPLASTPAAAEGES